MPTTKPDTQTNPFPAGTTLYHGSPVAFDAFDLKHVGTHATDNGHGIYFTPDRDEALRYATICGVGYLYTVTVIGTQKLSTTTKSLTRQEVSAIIDALDGACDYLSNYGEIPYEPYATVHARALKNEYEGCDTDSDLVGSFANACGSPALVLETVHAVTGRDCFHVEEARRTHYIALVPGAVHLVDRERVYAP